MVRPVIKFGREGHVEEQNAVSDRSEVDVVFVHQALPAGNAG